MRRDTVVGLGLAALAVGVWLGPLQHGVYGQPTISDLPVYERAADAIADGRVPYRDFESEYPPAAVGLFWLARVLPGSYSTAFSGLMLLALLAMLGATLVIARRLDLSPRRTLGAGAIVALLPLLIGPLVETRFDLAFAAVLAWTAAALAGERFRTAWALVAVGALVKIVSLALLPVLVIAHAHRRGWRPAAAGAALAGSVLLAGLLPFLLASPSGLWHVLEYHLDRPLQIESTGGAYLLALHALVGIDLTVTTSFGSQGFPASGADVIAAISSGLLVLGLVAIAATLVVLLRRGPDRTLVVRSACATVVCLLAFGKVLSPQFIVWLVPLGLVLVGRYDWTSFALTVAACLATLAYFPHHYFELVDLQTGPIAVLVLRDAIVLGLLAAVWPRPPEARRGMMVHPSRQRLPHGSGERAVSARYLSD